MIAVAMTLSVNSVSAKVEFVGGEDLDLTGKKYVDDVMIGGAMVTGEFEALGDVFAVGNMLELNGTYGDDLNLAAGQIELNGKVADDVRLAAGNIKINGKIGSDVMVAGGQITIEKDAVIDGDLYVAGGLVRIFGTVKGNVYLGAGQVSIGGIIDGDVNLNAEDFSISDTAKIGGNLNYSSKQELTNIKQNQVTGKIDFSPLPEVDLTKADVAAVGSVAAGAGMMAQISGFIVGLLMLFVTGLALVLLFPGWSHRTSKYFSSHTAISLLYGLMVLIVMPIVSILVMFTVIGIPLGIISLVSYFVFLYIAKIVASLSIGSALLGRRQKTASALILALALGVLITELITSIPLVGMFLNLILLVVALGAMVLWYVNRHKSEGGI